MNLAWVMSKTTLLLHKNFKNNDSLTPINHNNNIIYQLLNVLKVQFSIYSNIKQTKTIE